MVETLREVSEFPDPRYAEPVEGVPKPSFGTRLWFLWFGIEAIIMTIFFSFVQLISHQFSPTARNFKRNASRWGRSILRLVGIRVTINKQCKLDPHKPYVFVANHQNSLDILALADALPYPFGFIAKAELEKVPFLGYSIRNSASLFVDKSTPRKAVKSIKVAGERIRNGNSVMVFAEGQRTYSPRLYPLMKGAFAIAVEAGVPLVPITIRNTYRFFDERHWTARPGTVHLIIGEPISMEDKHRRDIPEILEAVRVQLEAGLAGA